MSDEPALHPRDGDAAEYVIGTLTAEERRSFERDLAADPALEALVRFWEGRFAGMAEGLPPVTPSSTLWPSIVAELERGTAPGGPPDADRSVTGNVVPWPVSSELIRLRRSRSIWRAATAMAGSLAAALAIFIASQPFPTAPASSLVAAVNRSGELPALIVRVDQRAGTVQVRALAAETPNDRSLELWSIVGGGAPRSLGIVAPGATRVRVSEADRPRLDGATIAVTVEPPGGSPSGGPTGPVVYTGKLVSELP